MHKISKKKEDQHWQSAAIYWALSAGVSNSGTRAKFSPTVSLYLASRQHTAHKLLVLQIPAGILARQSGQDIQRFHIILAQGTRARTAFASSARAQQETVNDNSRLLHLRRRAGRGRQRDEGVKGVKAAPVTRESVFPQQDARIPQTAWSRRLNKIRAERF